MILVCLKVEFVFFLFRFFCEKSVLIPSITILRTTVQAGKNKTAQPLSIFPGIPDSRLSQSSATPRSTKTVTAKIRSAKQTYNENLRDKIKDFKTFTKQMPRGANSTQFIRRKGIVRFINFKEVKWHFDLHFWKGLIKRD